MDKNDFFNKMENLQKPEVSEASVDASRRQIKLMVLSAKKTAAWGIWLIVVPVFFFVCITIKEFLQWDWGLANGFIEWMARIDKQGATGWLTPVLLVLLPAICALINLLAIMHFVYDKISRALIVTIRINWINIILAIVSIGIIGIVFIYGVSENAAEKAIHRLEQQQK